MITKRKNNAVEIAKSSLGGGIGLLDNSSLNFDCKSNGPYIKLQTNQFIVNDLVDPGEYTIDLSPYLPNDQFSYQVYLNVHIQIKTNNAGNVGLSLDGTRMPSSIYGGSTSSMICISDGMSEASSYNGTVLIDKNHNLYMIIDATNPEDKLDECQIFLVGYKRIQVQ